MFEAPAGPAPKFKKFGKGTWARIRQDWSVAGTPERIVLCAFPFGAALLFYSYDLGLPRVLRGFMAMILAYYIGIIFLILVVLERRYEKQQFLRGKGKQRARVAMVTEQRTKRARTADEMKEARKRADAAMERGRAKAEGRPVPALPDDPSADPSLQR